MSLILLVVGCNRVQTLRGLVKWLMFYVCAEHTVEWEFLSGMAGTIIPLAALPFGLNKDSLEVLKNKNIFQSLHSGQSLPSSCSTALQRELERCMIILKITH